MGTQYPPLNATRSFSQKWRRLLESSLFSPFWQRLRPRKKAGIVFCPRYREKDKKQRKLFNTRTKRFETNTRNYKRREICQQKMKRFTRFCISSGLIVYPQMLSLLKMSLDTLDIGRNNSETGRTTSETDLRNAGRKAQGRNYPAEKKASPCRSSSEGSNWRFREENEGVDSSGRRRFGDKEARSANQQHLKKERSHFRSWDNRRIGKRDVFLGRRFKTRLRLHSWESSSGMELRRRFEKPRDLPSDGLVRLWSWKRLRSRAYHFQGSRGLRQLPEIHSVGLGIRGIERRRLYWIR